MVWGVVLGILLVLPFVILQIARLTVDPDKVWDIITAIMAIAGIVIAAFVG